MIQRVRNWIANRACLSRTLVYAAIVFAVACSGNTHLFQTPIHEDGDFAANSFLIEKAKSFSLWHGNYSRIGFYHPGPGLLMTMAAGEVLLHDLLPIAPAPHNAHILACLALVSFVLGSSVTLVTRAVGYDSLGVWLLPVVILWAAWIGLFASHWFPFLYVSIYFAMAIAAAVVAAGHGEGLPWLAFAAGMAVHGHVCFVLFAGVLVAFALVGLLRRRNEGNRRPWRWFGLVALVFALPIAIHTYLHFPGEVWRYIGFMRTRVAPPTPLDESASYLWRVLVEGLPHANWLVPASLLGAVLSVALRPTRVGGMLLAAMVLSLASAMYYVRGGVDDLQYVYLCLFVRSVPMLGFATIVLTVWNALGRPGWRGGWVWAVGCLGVTASLGVTNPYRGSPDVVSIANQLASDSRWNHDRPIVTMQYDKWPTTCGLLLQLRRLGRTPIVFNPGYEILLTDTLQAAPEVVARSRWGWDFAAANGMTTDVIASWDGVELREFERSASVGQPVPGVRPDRSFELVPSPCWPNRLTPNRLTLPVQLNASATTLTFDLVPFGGRHDVGLTSRVRVLLNDVVLGEVTYPRDRASTDHRLAIPSNVKPEFLTFESIPPDHCTKKFPPDRFHFHTLRVTRVQFDR